MELARPVRREFGRRCDPLRRTQAGAPGRQAERARVVSQLERTDRAIHLGLHVGALGGSHRQCDDLRLGEHDDDRRAIRLRGTVAERRPIEATRFLRAGHVDRPARLRREPANHAGLGVVPRSVRQWTHVHEHVRQCVAAHDAAPHLDGAMLFGDVMHAASLERRRKRDAIRAAADVAVLGRSRRGRRRGVRAQRRAGEPPLLERRPGVVGRAIFVAGQCNVLEKLDDHRFLRRGERRQPSGRAVGRAKRAHRGLDDHRGVVGMRERVLDEARQIVAP